MFGFIWRAIVAFVVAYLVFYFMHSYLMAPITSVDEVPHRFGVAAVVCSVIAFLGTVAALVKR